VIELEPEVERAPPAVANRSHRRRAGWGVVAVAVVVAAVVALASAHHDRSRSTPSPTGPDGRFYPNLRGARATRLVLPSGAAIVLTGDLERTIGGLGAVFAGDWDR
jgi:hypothetical protein